MNDPTHTTLERVAGRLAADEVKRVLLTGHAKPDGDALGAVIALGRALEVRGKRVERRLLPPLPRNLKFLADRVDLTLHEGAAARRIEEPDAIVVLDTCAWSQLEGLSDWLKPRHDKTIVVDHHLHGDDVGHMKHVDAAAAAVCEPVAHLIDALGVEYDALIGEALYLGIASDTGWFRFSNTRPQTHELAARLQRGGVNHARIYMFSEQADRPEKLGLLARALASMKLIADGQAALMTLRRVDFEETGARDDETERFVDIPQIAESIRVVGLIVEQNGRSRVSLRSKPEGACAIDVNALASTLGGGGHARAAGAKTDRTVDEVVDHLTQQIERACGGS